MPGIPPDAGNILKRAFKGMFKRGKKNKQNTAAADDSEPAPVDAAPPQLPPIERTNSPLRTASDDASKPLPSTHPVATGEHSTPQEAVPQNTGAPATGATGTAVGGGGKLDGARAETPAIQIDPPASPPAAPVPAAADMEQSGPDGSAENHATAQPPTTGSATQVESQKDIVAPQAIKPEESGTDAVMPTPVATAQKDVEAAGHTSTTTPTADSGTPNAAPSATNTTTEAPIDANPATEATAESSDTAPTDQPPAINGGKPAANMVATSGPLEEFPQGKKT